MSKNKLTLKNISVLEYSKLSNDYTYAILNHVNGVNKFLDIECNIMQMPYTNVKHCMTLLRSINSFDTICEVFILVFGVTKDEFYNADVLSYYKARNHIIDTFKLITDNELKLSKGGNTDLGKWQASGGDRLNSYDSVLPLDEIGVRYSIYPFDLGRKPYSEVFYLMAMTKTINEVNYNYNKQK